MMLLPITLAAMVVAADAPVVRASHAVFSVVSAAEAQKLQNAFTRDLGLPAAWPVGKNGSETSGGVFLGNFVLEIAVWPQVEPLQLLGVALESRDADSAYKELKERGFRVRPNGDEKGYQQTAGISEFAGEGLGLFLCKYDRAWIEPRLAAARKAFMASKGGVAGVTGVVAIEISMPPARRESLGKLLAPADMGSWDPPIVFVEGQRFQIRSIKVKVRDVEKAKSAIPAGLPVTFER